MGAIYPEITDSHAIDEFFRGKPERIISIPDKSGTAVIAKFVLPAVAP